MRSRFPAFCLVSPTWRTILSASWRAAVRAVDSSAIDGLLVALFLAATWQQWSSFVGRSWAVDVSTCWALAGGILWGPTWRARRGVVLLGLATWSAVLLGGWSLVGWGLSQFTMIQLAAAGGLPVLLVLSTLLLVVPVACGSRLASLRLCDRQARARWFLAGAAIGGLLAAHVLTAAWGRNGVVLLAAAGAGVVFLWELASLLKIRSLTAGEADVRSEPATVGRVSWESAVGLVATGIVLAALLRVIAQLFPVSEWTVFSVLVGLAMGAATASWKPGAAWTLMPASAIPITIVVFPALVDLMLKWKGEGEDPVAMVWAWTGVTVVVTWPVGVLVSRFAMVDSVGTGTATDAGVRSARPAHLAAGLLLVGLVAGQSVGLPHAGVVASMLVGCGCVVGLVAWSTRSFRVLRSWQCACGTAVAMLLAVGVLSGRYTPIRAARLLFDGRVVSAAGLGWPDRLHEHLDEQRLVSWHESAAATWSVWSHRGGRRLLRRDGVVDATWSSDARICPRDVGGVLETALPLVIHQRPDRVLLLGLGGGEGLRTSLKFPVGSIDCVEPDTLRRAVVGVQSIVDPRLRWHAVTPAAAVASRSGAYDVIVSTRSPILGATAASTRTREFYLHVARQLGESGLFCQSLSTEDAGLAAMAWPLATLKSVFSRTACVPVGSGQVLLLATNGDHLLDRPGLVQRLQRPQVAEALAEIGWDWATMLQLPVHKNWVGMDELTPIAIIDGRFTTRLVEWVLAGSGPHDDEWSRKSSAPRPLLELIEVEQEHVAEVRERLSDLKQGRSHQQKWAGGGGAGLRAHRRAVAARVTKRPRYVFVSDGPQRMKRERHPVDRRRQQYVRTVTDVGTIEQPIHEQVARVLAYATPFDPVIGQFVHLEAAELVHRMSGEGSAEELRHRLHLVYFGDLAAGSTTLVVQALESLLATDPSASAASWQWDHCNALLERLKHHWAHRPADRSLFASETDTLELLADVLDRMDQLVKLEPRLGRGWTARREVVDRSLVEPLRRLQVRRRYSRSPGAVLAN